MENIEKKTPLGEEIIERPDYSKEIISILRSNDSPKIINERLLDYHENDIAEVLSGLSDAERQKLYRVLSIDTLSSVLEYAEESDAAVCLKEMDAKKAASVVSRMEPDVAVAILKEIEKDKRQILIDLLDDDAKKDIALLASFDDDEIGSRMTTNYITVSEGVTAREAMDELVRQAREDDSDNISTMIVIDENETYVGTLDLKDLLVAPEDKRVEELIMYSYPYVYGHELIDDCIERLKDYSENIIPVLDNQNKLLGVITSQNVVWVVDEAMSEDYAKLAGLSSEEELNEPLKKSMGKRLPWLLILLGLSILVSTVIGSFEKVIASLTIVMFFQSMILDMAGNVGTQSLAVTIRVLMDENLTGKQKIGFIFKELRIGFANGLILAIVSTALIGVYIIVGKGLPASDAFAISACVGLSLLLAMVISSIMGSITPMLFKKINVDPAVASGPLITTLNDLVGVVTYYSMAWILLIKVLHIGG